jgi:signal transduction histidine kinase
MRRSTGLRVSRNSGGGCDDVFRILFNLVHNAVTVANRDPSALTTITIEASTEGANVTIRISDDGPGLPKEVQTGLFVRGARRPKSAHQGHGLVIARQLAERNGGTLALAPTSKGTAFALNLPAFLTVLAEDHSRHLGRRAMAL